MAADQERAERIRQVRRDKHLRWKQIAAYVGVEMRSAQMWQETGAISWDNAQKLAELAKVDPHWLMSGVDTKTPDLLDGALAGDNSVQEQLAAIRQLLDDARSERQAIQDLLEIQNGILVDLQEATAMQRSAARALDQEVQRTIQRLRDAAPLPAPEAETTATSSTPAASKPKPA